MTLESGGNTVFVEIFIRTLRLDVAEKGLPMCLAISSFIALIRCILCWLFLLSVDNAFQLPLCLLPIHPRMNL